MDIIDLPVVSIETKLTDAFDILRDNKVSGIVATEKRANWLIKAGWIVVGIARHRKTLADIGARYRVEILQPRSSVDVMRHAEVHDLLDSTSSHYMIFSPGLVRETTKIVTRHEGFAQALSLAPSNCYCTNPDLDPHGYFPPLPADHKCIYDGSPIVCV